MLIAIAIVARMLAAMRSLGKQYSSQASIISEQKATAEARVRMALCCVFCVSALRIIAQRIGRTKTSCPDSVTGPGKPMFSSAIVAENVVLSAAKPCPRQSRLSKKNNFRREISIW